MSKSPRRAESGWSTRASPARFYWTEGTRGLGWAVDCVPTLKGGSTIGIPSPPAILMPSREVVTPEIRDAERMQGFRADWTKPAEKVARRSSRRKLVGNAVTVPVSNWVGEPACRRALGTTPLHASGKIIGQVARRRDVGWKSRRTHAGAERFWRPAWHHAEP